jgi:hypothetical protein
VEGLSVDTKLKLPSIDQTRGKAGSEPIVDIHNGDVRRAGVEHAEQRSNAAKRCTVADACGHGDNGYADESANDRRQSAFHAGDDNYNF